MVSLFVALSLVEGPFGRLFSGDCGWQLRQQVGRTHPATLTWRFERVHGTTIGRAGRNSKLRTTNLTPGPLP